MSKIDSNLYYGKYVQTQSYTDLYSGFGVIPYSLLNALQSSDLYNYKSTRIPFVHGQSKENHGYIIVEQIDSLKTSLTHILDARCSLRMKYGALDVIEVEIMATADNAVYTFRGESVAMPFFSSEKQTDTMRCLLNNGDHYVNVCLSMTYSKDKPLGDLPLLHVSQYEMNALLISLTV